MRKNTFYTKGFLILFGLIMLTGCTQIDRTEVAGHWQGTMTMGNREMAAALDIPVQNSEPITLSLPENYIAWIPVSHFTVKDRNIRFRVSIGFDLMRFSAGLEYQDDGIPHLNGKFLKKNNIGTFSLTRTDTRAWQEGVTTITLAGKEEELTMAVTGGELKGTLVSPHNPVKKILVLFIEGSGPTDRDGNSALFKGKNDSLKQLAYFLAGEGIYSLRYDKRGSGEKISKSLITKDLIFETIIEDACGWIHMLRKDLGFPVIIPAGHSQGSLIGLVASTITGADGVISLEGAGRPIKDVIKEQLRENANLEPEVINQLLRDFEVGIPIRNSIPLVQQLFGEKTRKFLLSWMNYDPGKIIAELEVPTLIVQGEMDFQTSIEDARILAENARQGELLLIPEMNHVLKAVADSYSNYLAYIDPRFPLPEELTGGIINFIRRML
ncbi:MAG: alpha/beta hydrolase [Spirochaetales bacterium]|nr:alpha/beta hydrolase [Spirochaetales bacterium]